MPVIAPSYMYLSNKTVEIYDDVLSEAPGTATATLPFMGTKDLHACMALLQVFKITAVALSRNNK